jgi:hypothetical protein
LFLSSITLSSGHASVDYQKAIQVMPRAGAPANQAIPRWAAPGAAEKLRLANVEGEWKVITHTNVVKLVLDDGDPEADAEGLFLLSPERAEKMKEQVPPRTWQAYEELKTKATK